MAVSKAKLFVLIVIENRAYVRREEMQFVDCLIKMLVLLERSELVLVRNHCDWDKIDPVV